MMKKLPLGISTLSKIITNDYLYIDKTSHVHKLARIEGYYFLSRPRRFGKSLLVDTLNQLFSGNQALFKGLSIEPHWDWSITYPVIHISFGTGVVKSRAELDRRIKKLLLDNQQQLGIQCDDRDDVASCFTDLIRKAEKAYQQPVVVLVDEYDKPILDNITEPTIATEIRDGLRNFYSVLKDNDRSLRFVFLTGVSKFSKISLFSGLNNLQDISLDERFATLCGYRQDDIEQHFTEHLAGVDLVELKRWYNGYNFLGETVYNPYAILLFADSPSKAFKNYWFTTGNPSFLIQVLKQKTYFIPDLENIEVSEMDLGSFDTDDIKLEVLLFQTGYLTISTVKTFFNQRVYTLNYPNLEVRSAFNDTLFKYFLSDRSIQKTALFTAIINNDMQQFEQAIYQLFAGIPYNNYVNNDIQNYEGYYASVMYSYLAGLGIEFIAEDVSNKGRIDLTIATPDMKQVYVIEFKVVQNKQQKSNALAQIKQKNYTEKYQAKAELLYIIGITFSKQDKNMCDFVWELVKNKAAI